MLRQFHRKNRSNTSKETQKLKFSRKLKTKKNYRSSWLELLARLNLKFTFFWIAIPRLWHRPSWNVKIVLYATWVYYQCKQFGPESIEIICNGSRNLYTNPRRNRYPRNHCYSNQFIRRRSRTVLVTLQCILACHPHHHLPTTTTSLGLKGHEKNHSKDLE